MLKSENPVVANSMNWFEFEFLSYSMEVGALVEQPILPR